MLLLLLFFQFLFAVFFNARYRCLLYLMLFQNLTDYLETQNLYENSLRDAVVENKSAYEAGYKKENCCLEQALELADVCVDLGSLKYQIIPSKCFPIGWPTVVSQ